MSIIQANSILDASGGNTTTVNGVTPNSNSVIGRSLIINGAMQVAQRGTSQTNVGPNNSNEGFTVLDRFQISLSGNQVSTFSQSTDAPAGFSNSAKIEITTAESSLAATQFFHLRYGFEGQDLQCLAKGTSDAKKFTVSFYVKSNKTGVYTVHLFDTDNNRQNALSYTINSSNTWERKTLTFNGDTTGALDNDNNLSLRLNFALLGGANLKNGTFFNGTWGPDVDANSVHPNQVNFADTVGNEWYITGVKFEVGDVATEFDHRSFGEELALCQRYFYGGFENDPHPTNASALPMHATSPARLFPFQGADFPVSMRTTPSVSIRSMQSGSQTNNATSGYSDGVNHTVTNINGPHASRVALYLQSSDNITDDEPQMFHFKADAEL